MEDSVHHSSTLQNYSFLGQSPDVVGQNMIVVAEIEGLGVVGHAKIEERPDALELVDIEFRLNFKSKG